MTLQTHNFGRIKKKMKWQAETAADWALPSCYYNSAGFFLLFEGDLLWSVAEVMPVER